MSGADVNHETTGNRVGDRQRRCKACGYIVDGLAEPRCPECGRGFDPNDPSTLRVEDAGAARRADLQMAALATVTAMLFITSPWMACQQLRLFGPMGLAIIAGGTSLVFVLGVAVAFRSHAIGLAGISAAPACALVVVQAASHGQWPSVATVLGGLIMGMLLRAAIVRSNL